MKNIVKTGFSTHLSVLRLIGLYPATEHKGLYKIFAYFMYIFFIIPLPTFGTLYLCVQENVTFSQICDNAFVVFELGCGIFKCFPFINNGGEIRKCIYMVEYHLFDKFSNKKQEEIIENFTMVCRRNYRLYVGCISITVALWAIQPLFADDIRLPVNIWLPYVNPTLKADGIYFFTYMMLVLGCATGAMAHGFMDSLIAGLMYFATCQITILKDNLLHLNQYAQEKGSTEQTGEVIYNRIKECLEHYNAILNFEQSLETTFSTIVFFQFLASVLVICISCLQLTLVEPFTIPFFVMIFFVTSMLNQVFFYCYYGTTLFEEHNTLVDAIYMCQWYEMDNKSKKSLLIVMERSKKPLILIAGKILELSLTTFTTILRRAYSLLAVLKQYR